MSGRVWHMRRRSPLCPCPTAVWQGYDPNQTDSFGHGVAIKSVGRDGSGQATAWVIWDGSPIPFEYPPDGDHNYSCLWWWNGAAPVERHFDSVSLYDGQGLVPLTVIDDTLIYIVCWDKLIRWTSAGGFLVERQFTPGVDPDVGYRQILIKDDNRKWLLKGEQQFSSGVSYTYLTEWLEDSPGPPPVYSWHERTLDDGAVFPYSLKNGPAPAVMYWQDEGNHWAWSAGDYDDEAGHGIQKWDLHTWHRSDENDSSWKYNEVGIADLYWATYDAALGVVWIWGSFHHGGLNEQVIFRNNAGWNIVADITTDFTYDPPVIPGDPPYPQMFVFAVDGTFITSDPLAYPQSDIILAGHGHWAEVTDVQRTSPMCMTWDGPDHNTMRHLIPWTWLDASCYYKCEIYSASRNGDDFWLAGYGFCTHDSWPQLLVLHSADAGATWDDLSSLFTRASWPP